MLHLMLAVVLTLFLVFQGRSLVYVLRDRRVHAPERARRHSDIVWAVIPVVVVFMLATRSWLAVVDLPHSATASAGAPAPVTHSVAQPVR
jgi:heme/copper-type cytochrome/quinol oxidase subunit 2